MRILFKLATLMILCFTFYGCGPEFSAIPLFSEDKYINLKLKDGVCSTYKENVNSELEITNEKFKIDKKLLKNYYYVYYTNSDGDTFKGKMSFAKLINEKNIENVFNIEIIAAKYKNEKKMKKYSDLDTHVFGKYQIMQKYGQVFLVLNFFGFDASSSDTAPIEYEIQLGRKINTIVNHDLEKSEFTMLNESRETLRNLLFKIDSVGYKLIIRLK